MGLPWYRWYMWYLRSMTPVTNAPAFALGHVFKAREARDNLKEVLDRAESGGVAVVHRHDSVVVLRRKAVSDALRAVAAIPVLSAVTDGQFSFWVDGAPVHAVGSNLDEAESNFLDALVDYAELWFEELSSAPNHEQFANLALLTAMYAGDRDELCRVVFDDD